MIRGDNESLKYSEEAREMYCIPHPQRVTTKSKLQARRNMAGEVFNLKSIKGENMCKYMKDKLLLEKARTVLKA